MNTKKNVCPYCEKKGQKIKNITLESVLRSKYINQIGNMDYRFCETPNCDIVYYAEDGDQVFCKDHLLVRVGIKEESNPRPVCYCFSHNIEGIELEIKITGKSTASEDITERLQDRCWCDTRNPAGRCCLGSVRKIEKELLKKHELSKTAIDEHQNECCDVN